MTPEEKNNLTNALFIEYVKKNNYMHINTTNEKALKTSLHSKFKILKNVYVLISNEVEENF